MSNEGEKKPLSPPKASILAAAALSAGLTMAAQPNQSPSNTPKASAISYTPSQSPKRNGDITAFYKPEYASVLYSGLDHFNNLAPELAHAYMITLESGWDHWQRDKKGNLVIYRGDPKQLPPKNKICDPAKDLPLVIGQPLPKISPACAIGLAQVIPPTAQSSIDRYNLPFTMSDVLYNPKVNFLTGHLYFMDVRNRLQQRFPGFKGLNTLSATGYNMGEGNQDKSFAYYGKTPASSGFDLRNYLATMPIDETKAYVPHILAQNHIIDRSSVKSDADGSWFNRNVDALTSYQQLRAGMIDFTSYFARSRAPFRSNEQFEGNAYYNLPPAWPDTPLIVVPNKSDFKVIPNNSDFKVVAHPAPS